MANVALDFLLGRVNTMKCFISLVWKYVVGFGGFRVCFVKRWKYFNGCLQGFFLYRRKERIAREKEAGFMTLRYTPVPSACEKHLELNLGMSEVLNYRSVHGEQD